MSDYQIAGGLAAANTTDEILWRHRDGKLDQSKLRHLYATLADEIERSNDADPLEAIALYAGYPLLLDVLVQNVEYREDGTWYWDQLDAAHTLAYRKLARIARQHGIDSQPIIESGQICQRVHREFGGPLPIDPEASRFDTWPHRVTATTAEVTDAERIVLYKAEALLAVALEVKADSVARPPKRRGPIPRLVVRKRQVYVDDELVTLDLTPEARADALAYLAALTTEWQSDTDVKRICPKLKDAGRLDQRVRKKLPPAIEAVLETCQRKGTRILRR